MTLLVATAYKETGKYYTECTVCAEDFDLNETEKLAKLLNGKLPFLENGFIHIRDSFGGSGFHNHLYRTEELKAFL